MINKTTNVFLKQAQRLVDFAKGFPAVKKTYLANLIGFDEYADLAVLKINEENLNHIKFSDQEDLEIGQTVYAIGNPYNIGISVSRGILSATGRNFGIILVEL